MMVEIASEQSNTNRSRPSTDNYGPTHIEGLESECRPTGRQAKAAVKRAYPDSEPDSQLKLGLKMVHDISLPLSTVKVRHCTYEEDYSDQDMENDYGDLYLPLSEESEKE